MALSFWLSRTACNRYLKPSLSCLSLIGDNKANISIPFCHPIVSPKSRHVSSPSRFHNWSPDFREKFRLNSVAGICILPKGSVKDEEKESSKGNSESSWIELYLPRKVATYVKLARLDKPIGKWLLVWPCMWSITLAAYPGHLPDFKMMALFGCGALLLSGAGCTVNDLLDRKIDAMVTFII